MNGIEVDPRTVAEALGMDTHDLARMLCGFASDALKIGTWLERSYKPKPLDDFDAAVTTARRQLEVAHAAWSAWTSDNPEYADVTEEFDEVLADV